MLSSVRSKLLIVSRSPPLITEAWLRLITTTNICESEAPLAMPRLPSRLIYVWSSEPPHLRQTTTTVLAKMAARAYSRAMALMDKIKKWLGMGKKKA
jgi:hypothetical protein